MASPRPIKVAACHASPIYLDPIATASKACTLIATAAASGANLVVFPESYIPGFPLYPALLAPIDHANAFSTYAAASILPNGPEIISIRDCARTHAVAVSLGFSERSQASAGCLWNSNVLISENGDVLSHHRKLVPTYWEKLVWSPGDGEGLRVCDTGRAGRVGVLICGENTNPLARFALMAQDEEVHIASFPPAWPTGRVGGYRNKTANAVRGAAHSFEAKCFTVVCAGFLDEGTKEIVAKGGHGLREVLDQTSQASTMFFGPDGVQMGKELCEEEGIAYAEFDLADRVEAKRLHDVVGGYQRYDVFELKVTRKRDEPVEWK